MSDATIYVSAPIDTRGIEHADVACDMVRPFQPLLGQDAQIAAFALAARADGLEVRFLAAPDMFGSDLALDRLRRRGMSGTLVHVRFGTPRLPRILKRATNLVLLAEDAMTPSDLGRHPFASGTALPACITTVLVHDQMAAVPDRVGAGRAKLVALPPGLAETDLRECVARPAPSRILANTTLHRSGAFREAAWLRAEPIDPFGGSMEMSLRRTSVLLPWNLAAPLSLVPHVLEKASLLAAQDRLPLSIVVLPYNDVPGSLTVLGKVAALCAEHLAEQVDSPAILWARPGSIDQAIALAQTCRRAWIDTADPEWRFTMDRMTRCGLPVNFISSPPDEMDDAGPFRPDDLVTYRPQHWFGQLFLRTRVMSSRRLATLADAIELGADMPFRPVLPPLQATCSRASLRDVLHAASRCAND